MAVLLGGHSVLAIRNSRPLGAGATNKTSLGLTELHGKAGEVVYLSDEVIPLGPVDTPIHLQAISGSVKVSFTLVNSSRSTDSNPEVQNSLFWVNEITVTPGAIVQAPVLNFAAMRVEFVADAELYIMGR